MADVAWSPAVPPGHTFFSWDSDQFETQDQLQREFAPVKVHTSLPKPAPAQQRAPPAAQQRAPPAAQQRAPSASASSSKPKTATSKPETKEPKQPSVDTAAVLKQISEAVKSWSISEEKGVSLTSQLTVLENGSLKWNKKEERSIEKIPTEQLELMTKEVEQCIATRSATVSQGLHDKYMQYIMNKPEGARQHGQIGGGHSLYLRGLSSLHGIGTSIDKKSALLFLHQAAEEGIPEAISLLGYCYEQGDGVAENPSRAVELLKAAVDLGDPHAAVRLGRCLWEGIPNVLEKDPNRAPQLIEQGLAELRLRVARKQDGPVGVSRALALLHSQMNLV